MFLITLNHQQSVSKTTLLLSGTVQKSASKLEKKSLFNMREACTSLSLHDFILSTIESLMQIEREEYL